ncbi:FMN reductase [Sphingobium lactosutens]|uniref:NADPH-dependent FMN reductase n=1 Tax=Sphingobium lactosutens TaxID=522773 RepID=UPI0015BB3F33|nr:NADPH-dependent FMN reductase [Sphingobium lactosutens]NWK94448.1 FMN reductase [Sphingobium lactosutens]
MPFETGSELGAQAPLIVGLGGTLRPQSSTERVIRLVLDNASSLGARTLQFTGGELNLPHYAPETTERTNEASQLIEALRDADAVVIGSPGYHGGISGLVKNALDYTEDLSRDARVYLDMMPVGCIATGAGWQGANGTLVALRAVTHSLRGWPTPMGIAVNTAEPVFDADGKCLNAGLTSQAKIMAEQILRFLRRARAEDWGANS